MVSDWKNLAAISINSSSKITFPAIVKAAAFFSSNELDKNLWADRECFQCIFEKTSDLLISYCCRATCEKIDSQNGSGQIDQTPEVSFSLDLHQVKAECSANLVEKQLLM